MNIDGIVALIAGGGSGLGLATAQRLVKHGAKVVILDRDIERAKGYARSAGDSVTLQRADVTSPDEVSAAIAAAQAVGPLRAVVNCAGIGWAKRTVSRDGTAHTLEDFERVIRVNLLGSFNVLRLAAAAMSQQEPLDTGERGVIVNTASVAAYDGQIGQVAYSASKGGIVGMTLPAARDLAKAGVRVNTIAPGVFDTPLLAMLPDAARRSLESTVPFPSRLGRVEEYAHLVGSIIENAYINGETIRIDGSLRMPPK